MRANSRFGLSAAAALLACTVLAGCGSLDKLSTSAANPVNWITPYRTDVIQGNFVSREQIAALRPGMTRAEVRNVMGTPLLTSVFHADRWDYVFTLKRQGVEPQSFKHTVFFKGDVFERSEGDAMPSETDFIARLQSARKFGKAPVLEATPEQLEAAEKKAPRPAVSTPAPVVASPATGTSAGTASSSYPPLESPRQ